MAEQPPGKEFLLVPYKLWFLTRGAAEQSLAEFVRGLLRGSPITDQGRGESAALVFSDRDRAGAFAATSRLAAAPKPTEFADWKRLPELWQAMKDSGDTHLHLDPGFPDGRRIPIDDLLRGFRESQS